MIMLYLNITFKTISLKAFVTIICSILRAATLPWWTQIEKEKEKEKEKNKEREKKYFASRKWINSSSLCSCSLGYNFNAVYSVQNSQEF